MTILLSKLTQPFERSLRSSNKSVRSREGFIALRKSLAENSVRTCDFKKKRASQLDSTNDILYIN